MDALKALGRLGVLDRVQVMWGPRQIARLIISIPVGKPCIDVMLLDRSGKKMTLRDLDRNFREAWPRLNEDWDLNSALEQAKALTLIRHEVARRMLPPWEKYDYPQGDLGWRMGKGEAYLDEFNRWWNSKSPDEKRRYASEHPAPPEWEGFYDPEDAPQHTDALISVLLEARELLSRPKNDFSWSRWKDSEAALAEFDAQIELVHQGTVPRLGNPARPDRHHPRSEPT